MYRTERLTKMIACSEQLITECFNYLSIKEEIFYQDFNQIINRTNKICILLLEEKLDIKKAFKIFGCKDLFYKLFDFDKKICSLLENIDNNVALLKNLVSCMHLKNIIKRQDNVVLKNDLDLSLKEFRLLQRNIETHFQYSIKSADRDFKRDIENQAQFIMKHLNELYKLDLINRYINISKCTNYNPVSKIDNCTSLEGLINQYNELLQQIVRPQNKDSQSALVDTNILANKSVKVNDMTSEIKVEQILTLNYGTELNDYEEVTHLFKLLLNNITKPYQDQKPGLYQLF